MKKHHPQNEKIKWQYLQFLEDAKRMKPQSVDQVAAAIATFEASTNWKDFKLFHIEQARKFKRDLENHIVAKTGKPLAVATKVSRLRAVKTFFQWLSGRHGYDRKLTYSDMEYFNPSNHDGSIAGAMRQRPVPSLEQIRHVLTSMPTGTVIERRNRALIAFTILSGARDAAIVSILLKHIDVERDQLIQDAREVKTKFRKTFTSDFYPVGDDIATMVKDWISELKTVHLFGPDDPVFPATALTHDQNQQFQSGGIGRQKWSDAGPMRAIFKVAFRAAGLPYFNPHSFRKTVWDMGEAVCSNGKEARAWSLNLGHENVMTSFVSYGTLTNTERKDIMKSLSKRMRDKPQSSAGGETPDQETIAKVLAHLQRQAS